MAVSDILKRLSRSWTTTSELNSFCPRRAAALTSDRYKLVVEALRERRYFLDTAPHLSSWLPIMIPVQKWWQAPYFWAGTKCYDFLAGSENIETSYFMTRSKALEAFPMLKKDHLVGALVYYGTFIRARRIVSC